MHSKQSEILNKIFILKIQYTPLNRATLGLTLFVSNKWGELESGGLIY